MKKFEFKYLLQNTGWKENMILETDENGIITSIYQNKNSSNSNDIAFPGFQNAHSHAFQYAMAGLAEYHPTTKSADDFWSWRNAMYQLALQIDPEDLEAIASMLYAEMVRHGYTHVAEFHYLHHDKNGDAYENIAEMGARLIQAAKNAGINITLVPIFYQKGGFGKDPLPDQKRFISSDIDSYLKLYESSVNVTKNYSHSAIGMGIHSMRAVETNEIIALSNYRNGNTPFHIHVSEQLKEIEDCIHYLNARPIEWLSNNISLSEHYHLVHATHLIDKEIEAIAQSNANVVLCPSTEGNLGDGLFPLGKFLELDGKWSIGTDSHVGLNPMEEIRILDYGQRLITHRRNTFANSESGDSGFNAFQTALLSGRKAMGNHNTNFFKKGEKFNAVVASLDHPLMHTSKTDNLCNTIIYSSDLSMIKGTIVNGEFVVSNGNHINNEISSNFRTTLEKMKCR